MPPVQGSVSVEQFLEDLTIRDKGTAMASNKLQHFERRFPKRVITAGRVNRDVGVNKDR